MRQGLRWLLLAALLGLGIWGYFHFFPSEETRVIRRLTALAQAACVPGDREALASLAAAQKLAGFFTADAELRVEAAGYGAHTITGRDEILQAALAAQSQVKGLKVEFLDITVVIGDDGVTATAELTAKVTRKEEKDTGVQELHFRLAKPERQWRIQRVETRKTLRELGSVTP